MSGFPMSVPGNVPDHKGYIKSTSNMEAYSVDRSMILAERFFGTCRKSRNRMLIKESIEV